MKILLLDIETAPHRVYSWGLWKQDIYLDQIEEPGYILCWVAKWLGDDGLVFRSINAHGRQTMLRDIHALLNEADIVVHYNGTKFDIPTLNQEFMAEGLAPPAPYKEIDLLLTARRRFRLPSNKLDYVCRHLNIEGKHQHKGMALWTGCMIGDPASWQTMEDYNRQDVLILEEVYNKMRPWINGHPNVSLYTDEDEIFRDEVVNKKIHCPSCNSTHLQKRGLAYTKSLKYQRYQCQDCFSWSRGKASVGTPAEKASVLIGGG